MEILKCIGLGLVATLAIAAVLALFGAFTALCIYLLGETLGSAISILLPLLVFFSWGFYDSRKGF